MTDDEVIEKFLNNAKSIISQKQAAELIATVRNLETVDDVKKLAGLLAETVRPVGQRDRLDTGLGDPRGTPVAPAQAERGLLGGTELVNLCDLRYAGHTRRNSSTCQGIGPASGTSRMNS